MVKVHVVRMAKLVYNYLTGGKKALFEYDLKPQDIRGAYGIWCHLWAIDVTTPHCLIRAGRNVTFSVTRESGCLVQRHLLCLAWHQVRLDS